jgi:ATP-dependent Zn protease
MKEKTSIFDDELLEQEEEITYRVDEPIKSSKILSSNKITTSSNIQEEILEKDEKLVSIRKLVKKDNFWKYLLYFLLMLFILRLIWFFFNKNTNDNTVVNT